ncbi:hypothetical protein Tsubulata_031683, partial [Turnera subulata]
MGLNIGLTYPKPIFSIYTCNTTCYWMPRQKTFAMATTSASLSFKIILLALLSSSAIFFQVAGEHEDFARTQEAKLYGLDKRAQKLTHIHFYAHDINSGPEPTAAVAVPPLSKASPTLFGAMGVFDDPLTVGPEFNSKLIGRAQGLYAFASQQEFSPLVAFNFVFLEGEYNGSTITIQGRNPLFSKVREMPIIGGSGFFRFATGYAQTRTYSAIPKTGDSVLEALPTFITLSLMFFCFTVNLVSGEDHEFVRSVDRKLLGLRKEKLSHFRMYWHDIVTGPKPTSVQVLTPPLNSTVGFGFTRMIDNPLTLGPEMSSKLVGKAQGFYSQASQEEIGLLMVQNFAFLEGKYNGSTITVIGRNTVFSTVREMPVVGGSGLFRFARGYVQARTHKFDAKTGDA